MNRQGLLIGWIGLCLLTPLDVHGLDLEIHGAMAQGFVSSSGNNLLGPSIQGSNDLFEVALNARTAPIPELLISAQLMARKAGSSDTGELRLDFAQLDYQLYTALDRGAGLRLGRLKNPYGFYNDSRDVVFSRPSITMPSAVYFEGDGLRDLFFASEGAQFYAHWRGQSYASDLVVGVARDFDATEDFQRSLAQSSLDGRVEIRDFALAQWMNEWAGGRYRGGLSYLTAGVLFERNPDGSGPFDRLLLDADIWVLSLQQQSPRSTLTFEYRYSVVGSQPALSGDAESSGEGAYLQYRRLPSANWSWYTRYNLNFQDRGDRDGRDFAAATGQPRHSRFSRDHVLGVDWTPDSHWGLFAEFHYTDGTADVSSQENQGRELKRHWQALILMLAYQF